MPTRKRKRVMLKELTSDLLTEAKNNASRPVFYMEQTGEIFSDYESYAARLSFYKLKQFQCEVTGKSGLDYFQALDSEQQEARTLHSRFPQPLKGPVLRAVQWQVVGRLDHLVEAVYERFKDRYFKGERVYVDIQGDRYWARIVNVHPPRKNNNNKMDASSAASGSTSPQPEEEIEPHRVTGDLKVPASQVSTADDPKGYYYKVQLSEDGNIFDEDPKGKGKTYGKFAGSMMDVQCDCMSRDRLSFSKSILRRFIRDCVDRDAAVASPWTVKRSIAERYGVESIMPEETRKGVEEVKNREIEKRKKVWEDKEGPPSKRMKKMEEKAAAAKAKIEERAKEEAATLDFTPPKKKYIKYPTEDLDVILSQREKTKRIAANGHARSVRPKPNRDMAFENHVFESTLMVWSFFMAFGSPLKLSPFTLDEFEAAIRHSDPDQPVTLISEIHSSLIYALRALATHRHLAVISLLDMETHVGPHAITAQMIVDRLAEYGNNWERQPLRAEEGRYGWEEALIGCIKDQATTDTFKTLPEILASLLFTEVKPPAKEIDEREVIPDAVWSASPQERYYLLSSQQKLEILSFLCDTVASHKEIHAYMESCEAKLTQLRKEKIEVRKERKRIQDDMTALTKEEASVNGTSTPKNGTDSKPGKDSKACKETKESKDSKESIDSKDGDDIDMDVDLESELSEPDMSSVADSDEVSDTETTSNTGNVRSSSRQKGLRVKAQTQAYAKQREIARAKIASAKQAQAEHRRLDEEDNKLERRMEGIEREFRKWSGVIRLKPLGKDRFHNRYWWFDGIGSTGLLASGGSFAYGAGRLFLQGPNSEDFKLMKRREAQDPTFSLDRRREDEEGAEGVLDVGKWVYYSEPDQLDDLMTWLNVKGNRELKLKDNLTKWLDHISGGMRKRLSDLTVSSRPPEARRSTRKNAPDAAKQEPYLLWQNKKAPSASS